MYTDWGELDGRWQGVRSDTVPLAGIDVHVLRLDGAADGPTQLLLHGLGGGATSWLDVMADLRERGPVLALDIPGFGRTPPHPRRGARLGVNTAFLRAFVRKLGIESATVHASSMGALLGVRLAAADPHRVGRLVLSAPALPVSMGVLRRMDPQAVKMFAPFVVPGVGARMLRRAYATGTPQDLQRRRAVFIHAQEERVRAPLRALGVESVAFTQCTPWRIEGFARAAESTVAMMLTSPQAVRQAVDAVTAPTLVLWGAADRVVPRAMIDAIARRRPDWSYQVLEGVGHASMIETPEEYVAAVGAWHDATRPARTAAEAADESDTDGVLTEH